ncbi:type 2 lanthipeptide synthetase LanM [uncultured Enterococcus sp.]|uniref:type 2 lanthipeptide synthetase LanM n=1 Tax=uncultured Enterococcus sp. TaxID=167972 RepID=UPI002AA60ABF|nr:type 2 lanthipeptide synthetase LanM [uncultured Enterococcus sp.]
MRVEHLAKATSIKQRFTLLKDFYAGQERLSTDEQAANFQAWRARPTLVTDERFQSILSHMKLTEEDFGFAVKALTEAEQDYIYHQLSQEDWLITTNAIFASEDTDQRDIKEQINVNFTYALRLHINYFDSKIRAAAKDFPTVIITEQALSNYIEEGINRFLDISLRTFVYDLHNQKQGLVLTGEDEKERFREYLTHRFYEKENLFQFFYSFPVLTRMLAEIMGYQIANFRSLLTALAESKTELQQNFGIGKSFCVERLRMGAGDSHDRGKTVAILTFDDGSELVYKPKDLEISVRFDQFVSRLQKKDARFDFYLTKKIVKKEYTFEERLAHSECESTKDLEHYYRQFGHTIALVYLLNGNDFHLENILAHGKYPVMIDLETIIQNNFPAPNSENALVKAQMDNMESVIMSGLVPIYLFEEKSDGEVEGAAQGVQLSALSGDQQKLPYKVLKLINFDSDNMQFVYEEHMTDAAENIPLYKGEKVDFTPYTQLILEGFSEFAAFARENRAFLIDSVTEAFSNVLVRNVIKTTQSYGDLLDYSTHPSCMVDYIEREKLLENLWMHSYSNEQPVPFEVRDMLQHDVPIFFNRTNACHLTASRGEDVGKMYEEPAITIEIEKLRRFSLQEEEQQLDYLYTSFGTYHSMDLQKTAITVEGEKEENPYLTTAAAIGQRLIDTAFVGEESIAWKNVEETAAENYIVTVMNENLYDGITGLYLYFSELYHATKDERFKEAYLLSEALVLKLSDEYIESISAFYGSFAAVYPLLYSFKLSQKPVLLEAAERIAQAYIENYQEEQISSYDWTGGTASIVKVFTLLFKVTGNTQYHQFAKQLLQDLKPETLTQGGFAHGYSGVIHAANSVRKLEENDVSEQLIRWGLQEERKTFDTEQKGWLDLRPSYPIVNDLWCYGATGIGMAYLDLVESDVEDSLLRQEILLAADRLLGQEKEDDCLCHGNFGDLEYLLSVRTHLNPAQLEKLQEKMDWLARKQQQAYYHFEGLKTVPKYGLFTGLSGIGHQYLRLFNPKMSANILTLELPEGC